MYFVYMIPLETDVLRKHRFHCSATGMQNGDEVSLMIISDGPDF